MEKYTLFTDIPDFRRAQGCRHTIELSLLCVLLSTINGGESWRDHAAFVQRHRAVLLERLGPRKDRLPSYSTLRRVLLGVDFDAVSDAFYTWACKHVELEPGEWLCIDGKSLRGTASNAFDARQNFTALVSLYAQRRGLLVAARSYENKMQSEAHVVEVLLADLEPGSLKGTGISLDAMHCRKKRSA